MVMRYVMYDIIESPHNVCTCVCQTPNPGVIFTSMLDIFAFFSDFCTVTSCEL